MNRCRPRNWAVAAGMGLVVTSLVACTSQPVPPAATTGNSQGVPHVAVEIVRRATITPVITLPGVVQNATTYQISARMAGVFRLNGTSGLVEGAHGEQSPVAFRNSDRNRTFLVPPGAPVVTSLPVAQATYSNYALVAPVTGANLLKLRSVPESAKGQVTGSGKPFDCTLLDPYPSAGASGKSFVACVIPPDQQVLDGFAGVLALRFPTVKDALVLPVEAVAGSIGSASVFLETAHGVQERPITVGATDGLSIVVTSGLNAGDKVQVPSPSLLSR